MSAWLQTCFIVLYHTDKNEARTLKSLPTSRIIKHKITESSQTHIVTRHNLLDGYPSWPISDEKAKTLKDQML